MSTRSGRNISEPIKNAGGVTVRRKPLINKQGNYLCRAFQVLRPVRQLQFRYPLQLLLPKQPQNLHCRKPDNRLLRVRRVTHPLTSNLSLQRWLPRESPALPLS